jgi:hypothetical protein
MYNIGVGLDASLLLCLINGFADLVFSISLLVFAIVYVHHFIHI